MREAGLTSNSIRGYTRTTLASTPSLGSGSADAKASLFTAITAKGSNPQTFPNSFLFCGRVWRIVIGAVIAEGVFSNKCYCTSSTEAEYTV